MTPECRKTIQELVNHFGYDMNTFINVLRGHTANISQREWNDIATFPFTRDEAHELYWYSHYYSRKAYYARTGNVYHRPIPKKCLSEDFIEEFQHQTFLWDGVSLLQNLSEDFIRRFKDKVNWENISWGQKMSDDFITEFENKIYWREMLLRNDNINFTDDFLLKFSSKIKEFGIIDEISERLEILENQNHNMEYDIIL